MRNIFYCNDKLMTNNWTKGIVTQQEWFRNDEHGVLIKKKQFEKNLSQKNQNSNDSIIHGINQLSLLIYINGIYLFSMYLNFNAVLRNIHSL